MNSPNSTQLQGLLFEMDDVLHDATLWRRWLLQLLVRMGLNTRYRSFFRVWDDEYLDDVHCGRREMSEAFRSFLLAAGLTHAQIDEVVAAAQARKRYLDATLRPLPGVRTTIQRLAERGVALGVLTDSDRSGDDLRQTLRGLGLGEQFSVVLSSLDLGRTKPDTFCYRSALGLMGFEARQVAFVGHAADDLNGARRAGLRTVAFHRATGGAAGHHLN
ncbi:MAG TPA: HAD-IA family hydrolase, partial [Pirellulales bacterium]|nr:HAD-IA family hydrolase [Pirellulales bacterium]